MRQIIPTSDFGARSVLTDQMRAEITRKRR
ncbi:MAG: hypothetical protein QOE04_3586, partial [Mycobacterium sp.]|nr:hypothetical protein [Mycobacterium sp.]